MRRLAFQEFVIYGNALETTGSSKRNYDAYDTGDEEEEPPRRRDAEIGQINDVSYDGASSTILKNILIMEENYELYTMLSSCQLLMEKAIVFRLSVETKITNFFSENVCTVFYMRMRHFTYSKYLLHSLTLF